MSVEKMEMVSAVGRIDNIDEISDEMVKCGCIHVVNAIEDISRHCRENGKDMEGIIRPYKNIGEYDKVRSQICEIMEVLSVDRIIRKKYIEETVNLDEISKKIASIHKIASKYKRMLDKSQKELIRAREIDENVKSVKALRFALSELRGLSFFQFRIGRLGKDYYVKLKENIENIPSIIYEISSGKNYVVVITLTPRSKQSEADDIFKSLGFEEIIIPERVRGIPEDVIRKIEELIREREEKIKRLNNDILLLKKEYGEFVERCFTLLEKFGKARDINAEAAFTDHVFYVSGWIPLCAKEELANRLERIGSKLIVMYRNQSEVKTAAPPTKLRNNGFARPFEYIVNMYGIPGYNEIDPTSLVALSYTIMFGAMFGDVGQGFVILAAGLYMSIIKKIDSFGGILTRVGISSMVFGFLYGSIFGNEEIIKPLLFHPLDNVNTLLLAGVIFGIFLSTAGYIINFINTARDRELEEGVFSEKGAVGFVFYWTALLSVYGIYKYGKIPVSTPLILFFLLILLVLMILKQPLASLIERKRPLHHNQIGDYYVENIFGAVETVLTMLSKTVSFVRVGAFAINHVGLFVAFATLAALMKNKIGGFAIMLLGNIIIIGLEGLIVFIQCLRLEFYELFSRFYQGNGVRYNPVNLLYEEDSQDTKS